MKGQAGEPGILPTKPRVVLGLTLPALILTLLALLLTACHSGETELDGSFDRLVPARAGAEVFVLRKMAEPSEFLAFDHAGHELGSLHVSSADPLPIYNDWPLIWVFDPSSRRIEVLSFESKSPVAQFDFPAETFQFIKTAKTLSAVVSRPQGPQLLTWRDDRIVADEPLFSEPSQGQGKIAVTSDGTRVAELVSGDLLLRDRTRKETTRCTVQNGFEAICFDDKTDQLVAGDLNGLSLIDASGKVGRRIDLPMLTARAVSSHSGSRLIVVKNFGGLTLFGDGEKKAVITRSEALAVYDPLAWQVMAEKIVVLYQDGKVVVYPLDRSLRTGS